MNFAVIGLGRTGHAMTAYLMDRGRRVIAWDRDAGKASLVRERGIRCSGEIEGRYFPQVAGALGQAARDADVLLVMTVANGHREVARALRGHLRPGQTVLVMNGNWGAYEFWRELDREAGEKGAVIAETGGMPLASALNGPGDCVLKRVKKSVPAACVPPEKTGALLERLAPVFPWLHAADSVLQTSLESTNAVLHAPTMLFNLTRAENGEAYLFYMDAVTPSVARYIERVDAERLAVARAAGAPAASCLELLNRAWGGGWDNLYDAIKRNKGYQKSAGPKSLGYRFITEDVPFGIVPVQKLARLYGVATPYTDCLVTGYSLYCETDFAALGPDFSDFTAFLSQALPKSGSTPCLG